MFRVALRYLNEETMVEVADIIERPPISGKYEALKALIHRFTDSIENQLRRLLSGMELGDKKPSQLLREMSSLASSNTFEGLLRNIWLQRLPMRSQKILVVLDSVDLDKLTFCADRVSERAGLCVMAASVSRVNTTEFAAAEHSLYVNEIAVIETRFNEKLQWLESLMQELMKMMTIGASQSRYSGVFRQARSKSP